MYRGREQMITRRNVIRLSYSWYVMHVYSDGKAEKPQLSSIELRYNHVLKWCNIAVSFVYGHN